MGKQSRSGWGPCFASATILGPITWLRFRQTAREWPGRRTAKASWTSSSALRTTSSPATLVRRWGRGGGVNDWSPDGEFILYRSDDGPTRENLWAVPVDVSREPILVIESPFNETNGRFSPAGGLLAYVSDVTGEQEVYVQRLDGMRAVGGAQPVSSGTHPVWRQDGAELYFLSRGLLMAVTISTEGDTVDIGSPRELFPFGVTLDSSSPVRGNARR